MLSNRITVLNVAQHNTPCSCFFLLHFRYGSLPAPSGQDEPGNNFIIHRHRFISTSFPAHRTQQHFSYARIPLGPSTRNTHNRCDKPKSNAPHIMLPLLTALPHTDLAMCHITHRTTRSHTHTTPLDCCPAERSSPGWSAHVFQCTHARLRRRRRSLHRSRTKTERNCERCLVSSGAVTRNGRHTAREICLRVRPSLVVALRACPRA